MRTLSTDKVVHVKGSEDGKLALVNQRFTRSRRPFLRWRSTDSPRLQLRDTKVNSVKAGQTSRVILLLLSLLLSLLPATVKPSLARAQEERKQVLYINAYHPGYKWSDDIERALTETFTKEGNIDLRVEYLDSKRIDSQEYLDTLSQLFQTKYKNAQPDLILSSDDVALNFLFKYADTIFPNVPVVFVGANYFDVTRLKGYERFTGISEEADIAGTLDVALSLHPEVNKVIVVNDTSVTGQKVHGVFTELIPQYPQINFEFLEDVTMDEVRQRVGTASPDTLVLITIFFLDKAGDFYEYDQFTSIISESSSVPVYGTWDFSLGYGIVGGKLTSGYTEGERGAKVAIRILNGESPSSIPVEKQVQSRYMFDYEVMEKWGIDISQLPKESTVINRPVSFYEENKFLIWGLVIGFIVLIFTIVFLLINNQLRFGLRSKLTLAITITTFAAVQSLGYFAYLRATQTQTFLSEQLQTSVEGSVETELTTSVNSEITQANSFLEKVGKDIDATANYASQLLREKAVLSDDGYWSAEEKLITLPTGVLDNPNSDMAAVSVPKWAPLTDSLKTDLETLIHLDFIVPSTLESNTDIVGLYFIDPQGTTIYYPNIDLANLVPADLDVTTLPFYLMGTPENNPERKNTWTPPYQDPAGSGLIVTSVSPIYAENDTFRGIIGADIQLAQITKHISDIKVGKTGYAFLIDDGGHIIAMPPKGYEDFGLTQEVVPVNESPKQSVLDIDSEQLQQVFQQMTDGSNGLTQVNIQGAAHYIAYGHLPVTGYSIALVVPVAEMNESIIRTNARVTSEVQSSVQYGLMLLILVMLGSVVISIVLSRIITSPLEKLTYAAQKISAGDLTQVVTVTSRDEVGLLSDTFNKMTTQLSELFTSLEQRVADRTKALATSAEVSRRLSTILNEQQLIIEVAEQVKAAFNYYHVHMYLIDETSGDLIMAGGTGQVGATLLGSGHKVPIGKGLVGRAAENNMPVLVPDTSKDPNWLPNSLLPETRSEAAVPIATADKVLGVLDVQHNEINGLQQEDIDLLQSLANQVAVALRNARSYVDVQQRAEREANITSIGLKIKSATSIEAALQATARELGRTLGTNDIRVILEAPGPTKHSPKPD